MMNFNLNSDDFKVYYFIDACRSLSQDEIKLYIREFYEHDEICDSNSFEDFVKENVAIPYPGCFLISDKYSFTSMLNDCLFRIRSQREKEFPVVGYIISNNKINLRAKFYGVPPSFIQDYFHGD